jgi:hypothetical protein
MSAATAKTHVSHLFTKLGARDRAQPSSSPTKTDSPAHDETGGTSDITSRITDPFALSSHFLMRGDVGADQRVVARTRFGWSQG